MNEGNQPPSPFRNRDRSQILKQQQRLKAVACDVSELIERAPHTSRDDGECPADGHLEEVRDTTWLPEFENADLAC